MIRKIKKKILLRDGHYILAASLLDKIVNFLIMLIASRYMSLYTFGNFSYVKAIVSSVIPFAGLGGNHSLLRFGMDTDLLKEKYNLLVLALLFGTIFTVIMILLLKVILLDFDLLNDDSIIILNIYVFFILSYYIFDVVRNYYRINNDNKTYAVKSIKYSVVTFVFSTVSLILFGHIVFLLVLVIVPLILTFIDNYKVFNSFKFEIKFSKPFWKYGFLIGLGAFLNQFFLQSDILILGLMDISPELIAQYKVATLLVYTFMFVPNSFLIRDFAIISSNSKNYQFLENYIIEYFKYSTVILILLIGVFYYFSNYVLIGLFGEKYDNGLNIQNILVFALIPIILLRIPMGNILNAVGKAKLNVINAVITFALAIPILFFFTDVSGIVGTAYAMLVIFSISGIVSLIMFFSYLKTIKVKFENINNSK